MVNYATKTVPMRSYAPGPMSGLDPQTSYPLAGQPGSQEFAAAYRADLDPRLSPDERAAAAAERAQQQQAVKDAAVEALHRNHEPPAGWVVVAHPDANTDASFAVRLDGGRYLIRAEELETAQSFGFYETKWA